MNEHKRRLLEECDSGCKMAVNSIYQVESHAKGDRLKNILGSYKQKHEEIESECEQLLLQAGRPAGS